MKRGPTIYIAGPMRGYDDGNFPSFDRQAKILEEQGWNVINPAEMDRTDGSPPNGHVEFDPATDYEDREFMREALERDMISICRQCTAIYMMSRWEQSRGAKAEWHLAKALGLDIYYESPLPSVKH
tara:strand:+ start:1049 stop:1426 length:378 start_codon:yes stop_codon:yes gene_type:complete